MLPYDERMQVRERIIKSDLVVDSTYGKSPNDRDISELLQSGIVNINKPKGPTSHQVSEFVKKILSVNKAGQSGTLDPAVTGVLPIGINKATRSLQALLHAGKEYVCLMHVHKVVGEENIRRVCNEFVGKIRQLPPIKSAVKREWRFREVYYLDILEISDNGQEVLFKIGCQAGTYIRKICDDIGKSLECGAHMAQLVRTKVGTFNYDNTVTLQELNDYYYLFLQGNEDAKKILRDFIFPVEKAVEHILKIWIFDSVIPYICNGANLNIPGIYQFDSDIKKEELVAIMTVKGELVAMGRAMLSSDELKNNDKGTAVNTQIVLHSYIKDEGAK